MPSLPEGLPEGLRDYARSERAEFGNAGVLYPGCACQSWGCIRLKARKLGPRRAKAVGREGTGSRHSPFGDRANNWHALRVETLAQGMPYLQGCALGPATTAGRASAWQQGESAVGPRARTQRLRMPCPAGSAQPSYA